jgi:hypothetical protein
MLVSSALLIQLKHLCQVLQLKPIKKAPRDGRCGGLEQGGNQAMKTAMKASKKIRTAPPTGNTMGMRGTMDSTTSVDSSE